jgi:hypothetical protein
MFPSPIPSSRTILRDRIVLPCLFCSHFHRGQSRQLRARRYGLKPHHRKQWFISVLHFQRDTCIRRDEGLIRYGGCAKTLLLLLTASGVSRLMVSGFRDTSNFGSLLSTFESTRDNQYCHCVNSAVGHNPAVQT